MKMRAILLTGVCGMAPALCAQQDAIPPRANLSATRVELPLSHPTQMIDKVACDDDGNIYARVWAADDSLTDRLPIQQITLDGALTRNFGDTNVSRGNALAKGIFVAAEGRVYQTEKNADGIYVVEFARDGSVKSRTALAADPRKVDPWQFVVFKSGGYLLSGLSGRDHRTPYTAVFDPMGKLVNQVYEPEDEAARQKAESGDPEYARSNAGNRFVGMGDVALGSDGNAYLLRGTSAAVLYVISPAGKLVRKLHIDVGNPDFVAAEIKSYEGRLAIGFDGSGNSALVKVTDLEGKPIAIYSVNRQKPDRTDLACYNSNGFTFVTGYAEKGLYILRAMPQ